MVSELDQPPGEQEETEEGEARLSTPCTSKVLAWPTHLRNSISLIHPFSLRELTKQAAEKK